MYLTYAEYIGYGGTLSQVAFTEYEFEASQYINSVTNNRLVNDTIIPEEVKRLIKKLIDMNDAQTKIVTSSNPAISAQSNDGVSVSYAAMNPNDLYKAIKTDRLDLVRNYLGNVSNQAGYMLLYTGFYPGERKCH